MKRTKKYYSGLGTLIALILACGFFCYYFVNAIVELLVNHQQLGQVLSGGTYLILLIVLLLLSICIVIVPLAEIKKFVKIGGEKYYEEHQPKPKENNEEPDPATNN